MKSYQLIHQLIDLAEELEKQNNGKEPSLQDFAGFLINQLNEPVSSSVTPDIRFGKNESYAQSLA